MVMKNTNINIFLLASLLFSPFACISQWQQTTGTAGLNTQSLLTNGIYNFAGGATGAYLSIDNGANYVLSNNGNDAVGPTRGFAKNSTYVYTCTSQGVYRSSDNGANWMSTSSGISNLLTSGIINVGTKLFVVGVGGIYKSEDNGSNWTAAGLAGTDVRSITAMQDTLYIGTFNSGIYKSTDWGANWISINNGLGSSSAFRAMECKGNTLFAAGPIGTGVYRSTDFGANWALLSGGLPPSSYRGFASNAQLIVAGSFGRGVFYSANNGDSWTQINSGLTDTTIFDLEFNDNYLIAATNTQGVFRFPLAALFSGTEQLVSSEPIVLYPNPTKNQLNFNLHSLQEAVRYVIYNYAGQEAGKGWLHDGDNSIDTTPLKEGVYYLEIDEKMGHKHKFIIQ